MFETESELLLHLTLLDFVEKDYPGKLASLHELNNPTYEQE